MFRIIFFTLIVRPLLAFFIGLRVRGWENLSRGGPFILVANHASHLDTAALLSLFPLKTLTRVRPVAAADYFNRNRCVAYLSRLLFNILTIERKHITREHNPLDALRAALSRGESLIVFPEGTRGSSGEIGPFQTGIAHMFKEFPHIPAIPVYLSNMGRALPKGELIMVPFICEVSIGKPLFLSGTKEEIIHALREAVLAMKGDSRW